MTLAHSLSGLEAIVQTSDASLVVNLTSTLSCPSTLVDSLDERKSVSIVTKPSSSLMWF